MRRLEVPVGGGDAGLHRQLEAFHDLACGEVVSHHRVLVRDLCVEALLVRCELPGAEGLVEPDGVEDPSAGHVGDGQLERMARRLPERRGCGRARKRRERAEAGVVEAAAVPRHLAVVGIDAGDEMAGDLARAGRDLVDPVVHERRHEQAPTVRRERHVVGASRVERPLPQEAGGRNVERRHVAEVAARHVERPAVGRNVRILRVVGPAGTLGLRSRRIDVEGAEDCSRGHVEQDDRGRLRIGHERDLDGRGSRLRAVRGGQRRAAREREHDRCNPRRLTSHRRSPSPWVHPEPTGPLGVPPDYPGISAGLPFRACAPRTILTLPTPRA